MSIYEILINAIAQNLSAIITSVSSLLAIFIGGYVTNKAQKTKTKADEIFARKQAKITAYGDLLSAYQDIRCVAINYASYPAFPSEGKLYDSILQRYCNLIDNMQKAVIHTKLYAPSKLAKDISGFSDKIYQDFIFYLEFGKTELSNDMAQEKDSKLKKILNEIENLEKSIQQDVNE